MTVEVREHVTSRDYGQGEGASATLVYDIEGTSSGVEAEAAMRAFAPIIYGNLLRKSSHVKATEEDELFHGEVTYSRAGEKEVGSNTYTFDTTGGTAHITQSLDTVGAYGPGTDPNDYGGAIGATKDSVEGCEIRVPVYKWTETVIFPAATITEGYKVSLAFLTGRTNAAPFRGFAIGEVLFCGAQGSERVADEEWEISFQFEASPNLTNLTVGTITGISKNGWEYLWIVYRDKTVTGPPKRLVKQPIAVYVEQVYFPGDFSVMGI